MKKYFVGAAIGILTTILAGHFYTNCQVSKWKKDSIAWEEAYNKAKEQLAANELASNDRISKLLDEIGGLQGNIDSLMFQNANLEIQIVEKEHANGELEAEADRLKGEVQPVLDANPKVAALVSNLEGQIENKDSIIFTLREQRENDKKIIFNLTEKYEVQVRISGEYRYQLLDTKSLLSKAEARLNLQDKRISSLEKQTRWKTYGLVGFGLVIALSMI